MSNTKIWFITRAARHGPRFRPGRPGGQPRGCGLWPGRDRLSKALGRSNNLLAVKLDVPSRPDAEAAVSAGVERFGCCFPHSLGNTIPFCAWYFPLRSA
jgi:hypothetical protein